MSSGGRLRAIAVAGLVAACTAGPSVPQSVSVPSGAPASPTGSLAESAPNPSPTAGPTPVASRLAVRPSSCPPPSPDRADDLIAMPAADRVACYGNAELTFTAVVAPLVGEGVALQWFGRDPVCVLAQPTTGCPGPLEYLNAYTDPISVPATALPSDARHWFRVTGHFDDDRAEQCTSSTIPSDFGDPVAFCRARLVITQLVPVAGP